MGIVVIIHLRRINFILYRRYVDFYAKHLRKYLVIFFQLEINIGLAYFKGPSEDLKSRDARI